MPPERKSPLRGGSPLGGPARPGFSELFSLASPKARIIALVAMLALCGVIVYWLKGVQRAATEAPPDFAPSAPMPPTRAEAEVIGVPPLDQRYADAIADTGPEERRRWEKEALAYLLLETRTTPAVLHHGRNLLPLVPESAREIAKDARPWRFKYFRFRGKLEYLREEDYGATYDLKADAVGFVHRGRVLVAGGDPAVRVAFVTPVRPVYQDPNEPAPHPESRAITDGWVRGRGILVKNFTDLGPDGEEVPAFLVVATRIERDYETLPVGTLEDVPFEIIDDDPAHAGDPATEPLLFKLYPKTLFRLVKYAEARAGPEGAATRGNEGLRPDSLDDHKRYQELLDAPAKHRGRYFGGLGVLMLPHVEEADTFRAENANDAGVDEYLTGCILTDAEMLFQFAAPASLARDWKARTRIRYEGFFYKAQAYYARGGDKRRFPFLVLTALEEVRAPEADHSKDLFIALACVAGVALFTYLVVREDKTKADFRAQRRRREIAPSPE
ncbi:MAG: hypothetical protein ACREID_04260 [Planctomycetota bacterium]